MKDLGLWSTEMSALVKSVDGDISLLNGEIPDWIMAIEDITERQEMMAMMGLGADFDITQSPFYNKIVIVGVSVEVIPDVKSTPFYNYMNLSQLTPGMETHANAIQPTPTQSHPTPDRTETGSHAVHGNLDRDTSSCDSSQSMYRNSFEHKITLTRATNGPAKLESFSSSSDSGGRDRAISNNLRTWSCR